MKYLSKFFALSGLLFASINISGCYAQSADSAPRQAVDEAKFAESGLRLIPLTVESSGTIYQFDVELAKTQAEQAQGLMFRTEMAPDRGMIFPFSQDRMASFWMKNTVIPLDIIFIRRDGTIESIAANTIPYSLAPVQSGEPVAAVLELIAGRAQELNIQPGDMVKWPR
ncbi:hypothetical protein A8B75_04710 [Sphingomonadales bacterium EhC05]|nr:hypothetical protein A8B75_04710 [Sphingomonadales bacterium EhC05]